MRIIPAALCALTILFGGPGAGAAIVSVSTPADSVTVGETFFVDFSFTAESEEEVLIAYQADLVWSDERLAPVAVSFSPGGSNPLDPEGVAAPEDFRFFDFDGFGLLAGTVPPVTSEETAAAAQPDSFVFARLFLEATAPGPAVVGLASALGFGGRSLADLMPGLAPAGVEMTIEPVPLPGALVFMGSALFGLFGARRFRAGG